ncbi:hypothetical protein BKA62DRAFT_757663 [Auriculariales sp. MPI-PUGE-AT-0066]|nr:hypothetical protein BKA62DRAFT_757663 [Auriculariales sp. MPI-PUGE-AT-0066]
MHGLTHMNFSTPSAPAKATTPHSLAGATSSSTTMPTLAPFARLFRRTPPLFRTILKVCGQRCREAVPFLDAVKPLQEFGPAKLVEGGHLGEPAGFVQARPVVDMRCISVNCTAHRVCHSERRKIEDLASDLSFVPSVAEFGMFTENTSMLTFLPAPSPATARPRTRTPTPPSPPPAFTTPPTIPPASNRTAFRDVANTTATTSDNSHAPHTIYFTVKAKATDSTAPRSYELTLRPRSQRASLQQTDIILAATLDLTRRMMAGLCDSVERC